MNYLNMTFEVEKTYRDRNGEYTVLEVHDDGTMTVYRKYDDTIRTYKQRIARMTIHNLARGK